MKGSEGGSNQGGNCDKIQIFVMEGVRKLVRSGSIKVEELFSSKNGQNVEPVIEDVDTDTPTKLPILRSFNTKGKSVTKEQKEYDEGFTGIV